MGSNWESWWFDEVRGLCGVGLWTNIRRWWDVFVRFVRYAVVCGSKTWFWCDMWDGKTTLKEWGLIARDNDTKLVDCLEYWNGCFYWNPLFIRAVHDRELEFMAQLLGDVDIYAMEIHCGEVVTWNGSLCKIKASKWRATVRHWEDLAEHLESLCSAKGGLSSCGLCR